MIGRYTVTEPRAARVKAPVVMCERAAMEWVCVYLMLVKNLPVLGVGKADYKTEESCINANAGTNNTFWCVTRNWLDKDQRKPVRAFVTD